MFNKYCAVNAPPAAGYYPYDHAAYDSLSDAGKRLIPVHSDTPLTTTRLLIESTSEAQSKFLLVNGDGAWKLPGGEGWEEEDGVGWDVGARVGSLQSLVKTQLDVDIPWMSYIEDVEMDRSICRVYGYSDARLEQDSLANRDWFTKEQRLDLFGVSTISVALFTPGNVTISFGAKAKRAIRARHSSSRSPL